MSWYWQRCGRGRAYFHARDRTPWQYAPRERLLIIFDALAAWFHERGFAGCMFINAHVGGNKEAAALAKSMATVFMNQAFE